MGSFAHPLPPEELDAAVRLAGDWSGLDGARLFITGGTGFFGKWLLETLGTAQERHGLDVEAVVLSRDPARFLDAVPHLRQAAWMHCVPGDVSSFPLPEGTFTHLIHAATSTDARQNIADPAGMRQTILKGAERVMELASRQRSLRMLFISSGAVYGPQPTGLERIPEDHTLPPEGVALTPVEVHAQAKRQAESIATAACQSLGFSCPVARCFTFVGPHLPLDQHFAIGNFIRDGLAGGPIHVAGDGTARRSYLYASDLAAWLWGLLLRGGSRTYHVGSDQDLSIADLAHLVARRFSARVEIAKKALPGQPPPRYIPAVTRIPTELGMDRTVSLGEALERTIRWHQQIQGGP